MYLVDVIKKKYSIGLFFSLSCFLLLISCDPYMARRDDYLLMGYHQLVSNMIWHSQQSVNETMTIRIDERWKSLTWSQISFTLMDENQRSYPNIISFRSYDPKTRILSLQLSQLASIKKNRYQSFFISVISQGKRLRSNLFGIVQTEFSSSRPINLYNVNSEFPQNIGISFDYLPMRELSEFKISFLDRNQKVNISPDNNQHSFVGLSRDSLGIQWKKLYSSSFVLNEKDRYQLKIQLKEESYLIPIIFIDQKSATLTQVFLLDKVKLGILNRTLPEYQTLFVRYQGTPLSTNDIKAISKLSLWKGDKEIYSLSQYQWHQAGGENYFQIIFNDWKRLDEGYDYYIRMYYQNKIYSSQNIFLSPYQTKLSLSQYNTFFANQRIKISLDLTNISLNRLIDIYFVKFAHSWEQCQWSSSQINQDFIPSQRIILWGDNCRFSDPNFNYIQRKISLSLGSIKEDKPFISDQAIYIVKPYLRNLGRQVVHMNNIVSEKNLSRIALLFLGRYDNNIDTQTWKWLTLIQKKKEYDLPIVGVAPLVLTATEAIQYKDINHELLQSYSLFIDTNALSSSFNLKEPFDIKSIQDKAKNSLFIQASNELKPRSQTDLSQIANYSLEYGKINTFWDKQTAFLFQNINFLSPDMTLLTMKNPKHSDSTQGYLSFSLTMNTSAPLTHGLQSYYQYSIPHYRPTLKIKYQEKIYSFPLKIKDNKSLWVDWTPFYLSDSYEVQFCWTETQYCASPKIMKP